MGMPIITPGTISREESIGNIIQSIAMEENSIAHILNAESEKLLAVINKDNVTPGQLLAINKSVKNTVDSVIKLEFSLKDKLSLFSNAICKKS